MRPSTLTTGGRSLSTLSLLGQIDDAITSLNDAPTASTSNGVAVTRDSVDILTAILSNFVANARPLLFSEVRRSSLCSACCARSLTPAQRTSVRNLWLATGRGPTRREALAHAVGAVHATLVSLWRALNQADSALGQASRASDAADGELGELMALLDAADGESKT